MNNIVSYIKDATDEEWKSKYVKTLKNMYLENKSAIAKSKKDEESLVKYYDPDGNSEEFYKELANFLTKRENELFKKGKLREYYSYKQIKIMKNEHIFYLIEVRDKKNSPLYYLKSDQFGFSAPTSKKNHPYDTYILLGLQKELEPVDKEKIYENVAKWIYESRSLGGSFLWPIENKDEDYNPQYNKDRGGAITSAGNMNFYIEDRVDLTLLEIKHFYECYKYDKDILFQYIFDMSNMGRWLKHFNNFETYVEFFCFENFVSKNDDYMPYDITQEYENITTVLKEDDMRKEYEKTKKRGIYKCIKENTKCNEYESEIEITLKNGKKQTVITKSYDSMKIMLEHLNEMICKRTEIMIDKLKK